MVRTVSAGVAAASVEPLLAVGAREPGRAKAAVPAGCTLDAGSSVKTRIVVTRHGADLTVLPVETLRTLARVVVLQILEEENQVRRVKFQMQFSEGYGK